MALVATEWHYKAEGRANVTFTYVGSSERFQHRVLRVRKALSSKHTEAGRRTAQSVPPAHGQTSTWQLPDDALLFATEVMSPLLGEDYLVQAVPVELDSDCPFLHALDAALQSHPGRPSNRAGQHLDVARPGVVLMRDQSMLPGPGSTICVEVKPKNGFPPDASEPACRYCMHQVAKALGVEGHSHHHHHGEQRLGQRQVSRDTHAQQRSSAATQTHGPSADVATVSEFPEQAPVARLSHYCPLDLYSGDGVRVVKAMWCLLHCPQNNLRLFIQGTVVFPAPVAGDFEGKPTRVGDSHSEPGPQPQQRPCVTLEQVEAWLARAWPAQQVQLARDAAASPAGPADPASCACAPQDVSLYPCLHLLVHVLATVLTQEPLLARLRSAQGLAGSTSVSTDKAMRAYTTLARKACPSLGQRCPSGSDAHPGGDAQVSGRVSGQVSGHDDRSGNPHGSEGKPEAVTDDDGTQQYEGIPVADWSAAATAMTAMVEQASVDGHAGGHVDNLADTAGPSEQASTGDGFTGPRPMLTQDNLEALHTIRQALTAASAKDCSLLLAVQFATAGGGAGAAEGRAATDGQSEHGSSGGDGGEDGGMERHGMSYDGVRSVAVPIPIVSRPCVARVSLAVVDLDVKPLARIPSYWAQERAIAKAFEWHGARLFGSTGKACAHASGGVRPGTAVPAAEPATG